MVSDSPLGKKTLYPDKYSPQLLHPIPRAESRTVLGLGADIPFYGVDIWNAWELTWLSSNGQPQVASAEIRIPASSPNIVESKSLKLYLNSFAMSPYESADNVAAAIGSDLSGCVGADVDIRLSDPRAGEDSATRSIGGTCLDDLNVDCDVYHVDRDTLSADTGSGVAETLYSHALRSLCPVTGQPDLGSVVIEYSGSRIDPAGLLRYIVSYRQHEDFHEACIERMYCDISERCSPQQLSVYARYQRRGGIDINPFRSSKPVSPENLRLWRQ